MADAPAAGDKAAAPAKSNKLLLVIALVFNVLIAGGLAYVVITGQKAAAPAKGAVSQGHGDEEPEAKAEAEEEPEEEEEGHAPKGGFGPLVPVGLFVVNLGDPANKNYLKVSVHVEAASEEAKGKVEAAVVPMRSEALQFFSSVTLEQAVGQTRIAALQGELYKRFVATIGKKMIKRVYFSEFVVQ